VNRMGNRAPSKIPRFHTQLTGPSVEDKEYKAGEEDGSRWRVLKLIESARAGNLKAVDVGSGGAGHRERRYISGDAFRRFQGRASVVFATITRET
jgi:hypothetical protein